MCEQVTDPAEFQRLGRVEEIPKNKIQKRGQTCIDNR